MITSSKERIEYLGNGVRIIISDKFNFTSDSILLANFSRPSSKHDVLDIGSGCGIIPLVWCQNKKAKSITAVEIDLQACDMFSRTISLNSLGNKISILNKDIKDFLNITEMHNKFDMIVCNPPYSEADSTKPCKFLERSISRHEYKIDIEQVVRVSSLLLKDTGYLCLCFRTARLCDVIFNMRKYNVEPKFLQFVEYKEGRAPGLFLIKGKKNSRPGIILRNNKVIKIGAENN